MTLFEIISATIGVAWIILKYILGFVIGVVLIIIPFLLLVFVIWIVVPGIISHIKKILKEGRKNG